MTKKISICVMLDVGHIASNGRVMPISEVELELTKGTPGDLLDFGIALATQLPLVPNNVSKAERGYQLFLNHVVSPQKAAQSPLTTKHAPAAAFQILARQGMQTWQANLLGTLMFQEQEFIHQFRVSLRRLNSLIKVFKPALAERYHAQWTNQVKTLSQITGDVRDLDVMRSGILEPILQSDSPQIREHAKAALSALDTAKQQAGEQLRQLRYGAPALMFARDLQDLDTDGFPKNLPRFAENQLSGLHRNAIKRLNKVLKAPTPGSAHRFRIALKHLRYSCEFFAPLFDNAEMTEYAKAIAGLQDAFGFINDFHVALSRLQDWVEQEAISKQASEAVAEWHTPHAQEVLASAPHLAEAVMSRCQPWCTECERRGWTALRRRIHQDVKLQVE